MMKSVVALALSVLSASALANSYTVYQSPNEHSARVGTVSDTNHAIVPIYQQGNWIEIGNRETGQIGWVYQDNSRSDTQEAIQEIKSEEAQLLDQHDVFMSTFNEAMDHLKQRAADLNNNIQSDDAGSEISTTGEMKSVQLTCHGDKGIENIENRWVDKDGQSHTEHKQSQVDCSHGLKLHI